MIQLDVNKHFLPVWALATTFGCLSIALIMVVVLSLLDYFAVDAVSTRDVLFILSLGLGSTVLGRLQAWVLRRRLGDVRGWTRVTVLGAFLVASTAVARRLLEKTIGYDPDGFLGLVEDGISLAATLTFLYVQSRILKKWVPESGWWVGIGYLSSFIAGVFLALGYFIGSLLNQYSAITFGVNASFLLGASVYGSVTGIVTGRGLIWMMRGARLEAARRTRLEKDLHPLMNPFVANQEK